MVLCFGEATKFSAGMFDADKSYVATLQFGTETDTGDCTGHPVGGRAHTHYPWLAEPQQLREVLSRFMGTITQIPPMYSALKRDGKPLYHYARQGIELERQPRTVVIHGMELLDCNVERGQATIEVACSKGTYIRTLAQDVGRAIGSGAHLTALRRTRTAGYSLAQAYTLEQLDALAAPVDVLLPVDSLLADLPEHTLATALAERFALGQTVSGEGLRDTRQAAERWRVYAPGKQFLGCARLRDGWLKPDRLMALNKESST